MLANVTCPACQHKYWIQEGEMGSRQICPNCQSPFFAGASVAEARSGASPVAAAAAAAATPALQGGYAKTMIGDSAPPIKYNCPRCKAPLEGEAGTKKNCPSCTQRHQVPAQSKSEPAAAAPNLNKTMLAGDETAAAPPPRPPIKYNCPGCKKPLEAPAEKGGTKTNCPACNQRLQIPAAMPLAANRNKTMLAGDESASASASPAAYAAGGVSGSNPMAAGPAPAVGPWAALLTPKNVAIGVALGFVMLLLLLIVPALIRGGAKDVDQNALAQRQLELEKLKMELEAKRAEMDRQAKEATAAQRRIDEEIRENRAREDSRRQEEQRRLRDAEDDEARARLKRKFAQEQQDRERDRLETDRKSKQALEDAQRKLDETKRALETSQQKQTVIQQQPAPIITYPPYNPYYYRPHWWW